jgi:hypothetical protein
MKNPPPFNPQKNPIVHASHILGGFLVGLGFWTLYDLRALSSPTELTVHFILFLTLFLLGLGYLAE